MILGYPALDFIATAWFAVAMVAYGWWYLFRRVRDFSSLDDGDVVATVHDEWNVMLGRERATGKQIIVIKLWMNDGGLDHGPMAVWARLGPAEARRLAVYLRAAAGLPKKQAPAAGSETSPRAP